MKPVVLLVGRLPGVIGATAQKLADMPVEWLGAHNRVEVIRQLAAEPRIACVVMGAGLDDDIRGELIGVIAERRPDISIHLKDRELGSRRPGAVRAQGGRRDGAELNGRAARACAARPIEGNWIRACLKSTPGTPRGAVVAASRSRWRKWLSWHLRSTRAQALLTAWPEPSGEAGWAHAARVRAARRLAAMGAPGRRDEYWRFTDPTSLTVQPAPVAAMLAADAKPAFADVDRLRIVFVDGVFAPELSDALDVAGIEIQPLASALGTDIHWAREIFGVLEARGQKPVDRPLAALNTARAAEGMAIRVGGQAKKPVNFVYLRRSETAEAMVHHVIHLEAGADLTLLENGRGGGAAEHGAGGRGGRRRRVPPCAHARPRSCPARRDGDLCAAGGAGELQVLHADGERPADAQRMRGRVHRRRRACPRRGRLRRRGGFPP